MPRKNVSNERFSDSNTVSVRFAISLWGMVRNSMSIMKFPSTAGARMTSPICDYFTGTVITNST